MFKFKNKLKFGTSSSEKQSTPTPPALTPPPPGSASSASAAFHHNGSANDNIAAPRQSTDSRNTISTSDLADDVSKLTVNTDGSPEKASTLNSKNNDRESASSSQQHSATATATSTAGVDSNGNSIFNASPTSSQATSSQVSSGSEQQGHPASPGLLTVKIYGSQNVQLPIKINNSKQILHALAINANNESVGQKLLKNLTTLEKENHDIGDFLSGAIATNFLPSIITIPNAENLVKSLLYLTIEFDNNVLVIEPQKGTVNQSTWNQVVSFDVSQKSQQESGVGSNFLNLNLFIRLPNMLIPENEKASKKHLFTNFQQGQQGGESGTNIGDLLIGTIKLPLNLKCHAQQIRLMNHEYLKFSNYNANLQDLISNDMGEIMLTIEFKPLTKKRLSIEDFDLLKLLGRGSFGKVMQVVKKDTKQIYALKIIRKQHIVSRLEVTHTLAERTVLARITNPFIVPLKFSFQSPEKLYLVLSFINGGELFWHLQREGKFSMDRSRFYIAELLTALESLHELNVIYRDVKPENILLDYQGHIALCDFGLCKLNMSNDDKTNTFCGTPEYLAPELLLNQGYTRSVDWWTLGTLLYEMLTGLPPFYDDDVPTMYKKILQNTLRFPTFLEGTDAQDLLIKLLQKDPSLRLDEAAEIKSHPFFKDIDWNKLLNKSYLPPFKPNVENLLDTSNFDPDFTNEKPQDSVVDDFLTESVQKQFGGWTYNGDNVL
ncbi:Serine/threonine-protein kinase YPK2/YKR2 [Candida viswanathii]|uniref:non-specific serine/threonine protein kinase n=1 Tax=Candida viswanathii TaxID=5486 RepID=A0A367YC08_9ASCO|nr:Serine/threonine-protein kinase YPK2/YKR2 [Candida viswanathii]